MAVAAVLRWLAGWGWLGGRAASTLVRGEEWEPGGDWMQESCSALAGQGRELAATSERVVRSAMVTAQRSHQQSSNILAVSAMSEQIRTAAEQSSRNSAATVARMADAFEKVSVGTAVVRQRTELLEAMAGSASHCTELMDEVAASVLRIERVVGLIREIANQTNLLALNAAIEAARAGEHGAGFNVVAKEVRLLADRTTSATVEIGEMIAGARGATGKASVSMHKNRVAVTESAAMERAADAALQEILQSIAKIGDITQEVSVAASQQIAAADKVNVHLRELAETTNECTWDADASAELSTQMIRSSRELESGMEEMAQRCSAENGAASGSWRPGSAAVGADRWMEAEAARPQMEAALEVLRELCLGSGPARLQVDGREGADIWFGSRAGQSCGDLVDEVQRRTGLGATLFMRREDGRGVSMQRVATSVLRADGSRAVGTVLNPRGVVLQQLLQGEAYFGYAYILGRPYVAGYEPMLGAEGEVIGAWYVGRAVQPVV